jgi:hypothetical protein
MAVLTLCGKSTDDNPIHWQTFVVTWSCVVFPELVEKLTEANHAKDYTYHVFDDDFIESCVAACMSQGDDATAGDVFVTAPRGLPTISTIPVNADLVNGSSIEGLHVYYAMLVFIMGKSINADNLAAISTKRPAALMRKRQIATAEYILLGDGKVSEDNYRKVQSGWARSTRPRMVIVPHLAALNAASTKSENLDSISVNMDMLRNAGQSYVYYIHELLVACDFCVEIPALRSSFYHYVKMVHILAAVPDYIRPFYKLMMQDASKDVRRRDIEPLIAVATFFAAQTRKSMKQYRVSEDAAPVIKAFRDLAVAKGFSFQDVSNQAVTETTAV